MNPGRSPGILQRNIGLCVRSETLYLGCRTVGIRPLGVVDFYRLMNIELDRQNSRAVSSHIKREEELMNWICLSVDEIVKPDSIDISMNVLICPIRFMEWKDI